MIKFRPLTKDEAQSAVHFCGRCETWQKRFELHHCTPTERWKAAKAAMGVHTKAADPVHSVRSHEPVHLEPVHSTVEEEHLEVDKIEVDRVDSDCEEVDTLRSREEARREYEREYKRRKGSE